MVDKQKLSNFIIRILDSSQLQVAAGAIQKAFKEEIFLNAEEVHKYLKKMEEVWDDWKKESDTDFISRFIEERGPYIFVMWLSEIFPFEFKQLEASFPRGPSSVDSLLEVIYNYSKDELKIIKDLLIKYGIEAEEDQVATTLFVEAIKSISDNFSKVINQSYKIFTSSVDLTNKRGNLKIDYKGAGRVVQ
ncbi:MAG TPA: hypothetical protein VMV49_00020 [Candidatus Deferrimicrobium sp.]|nr:hypothetical protein [Candidatus Deferrimicrobium sp.]